MHHYLLDTHILLWWLSDSQKLSDSHRAILCNGKYPAYVSAASLWEIGIKQKKGLIELPDFSTFDDLIEREGFSFLTIKPKHAIRASQLPMHHSDPFDRMLVAQAQLEQITLLSVDRALVHYDVQLNMG